MDKIKVVDCRPEERDLRALARCPELPGNPKISVRLVPYDMEPSTRKPLYEVADQLLARIDEVKGLVRKETKAALEKRRAAMRFLLVNLFAAWRRMDVESEEQTGYVRPYISFPRDRNPYSKNPMLKKYRLVHRPMVDAADGLEMLNLIERKNHSFDKEKRTGTCTRIRANIELIEILLDKHFGNGCILEVPTELIVMRSVGDKKNVDVSRKRETKRLEPDVVTINDMLSKANVTLRITRVERIAMVKHNSDKAGEQVRTSPLPNPAQNRVHRTFNNNRFDNGGRFYGHWVQNIPREFRDNDHLYVGGSPAVELDYSEYHIRMLYRRRKPPLDPPDGDQYDLAGWDRDRYRGAIKRIVNTLINASDQRSAENSVMFGSKDKPDSIAKRYGLDLDTVRAIIKAIKEKHQAVADELHSGAGVELQYTDSEIARRVMLSLWSRGVPCIPLHDSFVVSSGHAPTLAAVMEEETIAVFGEAMPFDVKHGKKHYSLDKK